MKTNKRSRNQDEPLEMNITKNPETKTGLVLSGGGAKSIFQAQVARRLLSAGYSFDIISGVSAGSLNAAIMSQKNGKVVELWKDVNKGDLFSGGITFWRLLKMAFGWEESIYNNDGLHKFLRDNYNPRYTKIPFIIGSVNLHTAEYNEFEITPDADFTSWRAEEVYQAIIASSAIPILFPPVSNLGLHENHLFSDGGLRNITPLQSMVKRDVDEILVIMCSPRHLGTTSSHLNSPFEIAERSFDILLNEIVREDIDSVLKVNRLVKQCGDDPVDEDGREYRHIDISLVEPRFGLGGMLDFSNEIQKKRLEEANNVCDRILEN